MMDDGEYDDDAEARARAEADMNQVTFLCEADV